MRQKFAVATLALALVGTACSGQAAVQQAVEKAAVAQVSNLVPTVAGSQSSGAAQSNTPSQGITVQGSQGQKVTVSGNLPDALKTFPVPDGFTINKDGYGSITANGGTFAIGSWTGTGTAKAVGDFYSKSLKQQGWSEQYSVETPNGGSMTYAKGDSQANITIDTSDSKTTKVSVSVGLNLASPTAAADSAAKATPAPASGSASKEPTKPAQSVAKDTPASVQVASGGGIPVELSNLPIPPGFTVVADSSVKLSSGNQVNMATAGWSGTSNVADTAAFYKKAMTPGWTEVSFMEADSGFVAAYTSAKDPKVSLVITGAKTDAGTDIAAVLNTTAQ